MWEVLCLGLRFIINMACNNTPQASISTISQGPTEEGCVRSLISRLQLQGDSTVSTSSTYPDSSGSEAISSSWGELSKPLGFLTLARELRDIIYSDLISSGHIAILQVSQQLHNEAKELLYKKGISRLCLDFRGPSYHPELVKPTMMPSNQKVQNYDIVMYPNRRDIMAGSSKINPVFVQSIKGSGNCHITLVFRGSPHMPPVGRTLKFIECFRTFQIVTLRVHMMHHFHPMDRRIGLVVEPVHKRILQDVAVSLPSALGNPEWKSDTCSCSRCEKSPYAKMKQLVGPFCNAQYLEFHPREGR